MRLELAQGLQAAAVDIVDFEVVLWIAGHDPHRHAFDHLDQPDDIGLVAQSLDLGRRDVDGYLDRLDGLAISAADWVVGCLNPHLLAILVDTPENSPAWNVPDRKTSQNWLYSGLAL